MRVARQAVDLAGPGDAAANWVAERQRRVIGRGQAEVCGLGRRAIEGRCRRRSWRPLFRGAFAIGSGELDHAARALGAVLALGGPVAAGGCSAGWLYGIVEHEPDEVDITILDGRNRARLGGVRLHRPCAARAPGWVRWRQGVPLIEPVDALLELAGRLDAEELEAACALALRKRLVTRVELWRRADDSPPRPGIATLRSLATAPGLTRSDTERRVLRLLRQAELPPPETNVSVGGKEVDLFWREAGLAVEIDAFGTHGTRADFEDDRKVDADLAAAGIEVRRFTRRRVLEQPNAVVARIAALLTLRLGGLPPPRRGV